MISALDYRAFVITPEPGVKTDLKELLSSTFLIIACIFGYFCWPRSRIST